MSNRQRQEATGKHTPGSKPGSGVMWRGKRYTLPRPEAYPLEAIEAEENGRTLDRVADHPQ